MVFTVVCAPKQSSVFTTVFLSLLLSDETVMKEFQTDNRVEWSVPKQRPQGKLISLRNVPACSIIVGGGMKLPDL
jgi:hypothetical protein